MRNSFCAASVGCEPGLPRPSSTAEPSSASRCEIDCFPRPALPACISAATRLAGAGATAAALAAIDASACTCAISVGGFSADEPSAAGGRSEWKSDSWKLLSTRRTHTSSRKSKPNAWPLLSTAATMPLFVTSARVSTSCSLSNGATDVRSTFRGAQPCWNDHRYSVPSTVTTSNDASLPGCTSTIDTPPPPSVRHGSIRRPRRVYVYTQPSVQPSATKPRSEPSPPTALTSPCTVSSQSI